LGAAVHCQDSEVGTLAKLVVDPQSQQVTDLIVEKGLLRKHAWVVPVSTVIRATLHEIYLSIPSHELENCDEYRETEIKVPAGDESGYAHSTELGAFGAPSPVTVPMVRKRLREGIGYGKAVIGSKADVEALGRALGHVDHVLVDKQRGEITQVVMRRGFPPERILIPSDKVTEIEHENILVDLTRDELAELPRYHPASE
jgi:uncharacterized protein YrrD